MALMDTMADKELEEAEIVRCGKDVFQLKVT